MSGMGSEIKYNLPKIICGILFAVLLIAAFIAGFDTTVGKILGIAALAAGVVCLLSLGAGKKLFSGKKKKNDGADGDFYIPETDTEKSSAAENPVHGGKAQNAVKGEPAYEAAQTHGYDVFGRSGPATDLPAAAVNLRMEKSYINSGLVFHESRSEQDANASETYVSMHAADDKCVFRCTEFSNVGDPAAASVSKKEAAVPFIVLYDNHGKAIELVNDRFKMQLTKENCVDERKYNEWVSEKSPKLTENGKSAFEIFSERTEMFFKVEDKNSEVSHYFAADKVTNRLFDVYMRKDGFEKLPVEVTYDQFVRVIERMMPGIGKFCKGLKPETRKNFDMTAIRNKWKLEKSTEKIIEKKKDGPSFLN